MKWIEISGTWRTINSRVEHNVRSTVKEITQGGNGIVAGGALGVDFFATDEALKHDPTASRIKVFLPTSLPTYAAHYRKRAEEGVITPKQAEILIQQLEKLKQTQRPS